jgi:hypothetical protein
MCCVGQWSRNNQRKEWGRRGGVALLAFHRRSPAPLEEPYSSPSKVDEQSIPHP